MGIWIFDKVPILTDNKKKKKVKKITRGQLRKYINPGICFM